MGPSAGRCSSWGGVLTSAPDAPDALAGSAQQRVGVDDVLQELSVDVLELASARGPQRVGRNTFDVAALSRLVEQGQAAGGRYRLAEGDP